MGYKWFVHSWKKSSARFHHRRRLIIIDFMVMVVNALYQVFVNYWCKMQFSNRNPSLIHCCSICCSTLSKYNLLKTSTGRCYRKVLHQQSYSSTKLFCDNVDDASTNGSSTYPLDWSKLAGKELKGHIININCFCCCHKVLKLN